MRTLGDWKRWRRALAFIGGGMALAVCLITAWMLPAPTKAADRIIAGEPDTWSVPIRSEEARWAQWIGPADWDVRFIGSATIIGTAGRRNPFTFHDLTGARPDWSLPGDWTDGGEQRPANLAWPYAFSADGTALAGHLGSGHRPLRIWEVPSGRERVAVELASRSIEQLAFSADGKRLAILWERLGATSHRGSVGMTIVDAQTGAERGSFRIDKETAAGRMSAVAASADSETLAIRRAAVGLELWDVPSSRLRATIPAQTDVAPEGAPLWVCFSPDGSSVGAVLPDGTIGLWDAVTGAERFRDQQAVAPTASRPFFFFNKIFHVEVAGRPFAFSADSRTLGVACRNGAVHLWHIPSSRLRSVLPPPVPSLESSGLILFSRDGRYLVLAGEGAPRSRIHRLPAALRDRLARDTATGNSDVIGRLIVWDLTTGRNRLVAQAGGRFSALAFAPDGSRLAAAREQFFSAEGPIYLGKTERDVMLWPLD
jgi:WD40 repeat protein